MPELGEPISERERDVLNCLAEGASNREIADRLSISHNTVKVHVRNIYTKLGVSSRTEATTVALQKGVLSIPGIETEATETSGADDQDRVAGTDEGSPEAPEPPVADDDLAPIPAGVETGAARPAPPVRAWRGLSRRQLSIIIGLLGVLLLAVAVNSLMSSNLNATSDPTLGADGEPLGTPFAETPVGDNWVLSRGLPEPRVRMALATVGLNLYAIGGENSEGIDNAVFIFDSQQHQWREGAPKLTAVSAAAAGVLAGEIYVVGGYAENGLATTAVEAYSPLNDAWRPVPALPRPIAGAVAIVNDDRLYIFGGEDDEGALAAAFVFDPGEQRWSLLPPMQEPRAMAVGGVLGGKFHIAGGRNGETLLSSCERYDPQEAAWSACSPLQQARAAAGSAVILNKMYVLGGELSTDNGQGEIYDPTAETWTTFEIPLLSEVEDWPYLGVANVETHIYALGGEREGRLSDELYVYRPLVYQFFIPAASGGGE